MLSGQNASLVPFDGLLGVFKSLESSARQIAHVKQNFELNC